MIDLYVTDADPQDQAFPIPEYVHCQDELVMHRKCTFGVLVHELSVCDEVDVLFFDARVDWDQPIKASAELFASWRPGRTKICRWVVYWDGELYPRRVFDTHLATRYSFLTGIDDSPTYPNVFCVFDSYTGANSCVLLLVNQF